MLDRLNFHLGEIIGLIYALEKRYYQNKTQLGYNWLSIHATKNEVLWNGYSYYFGG